MKLKMIYNAVLNKNERKRIRDAFADAFGILQPTIYSWLSGRVTPPERYQASIANIMGIPVAELFPNTEKCSA